MSSEGDQEKLAIELIKRLDPNQVKSLLIYLHNVIDIDKDCKN